MTIPIEISARVEKGRLLVAYDVRNRGDQEIALHNGLFEWHAEEIGPPSNQLAYVCHGGGELVVLYQGHINAPIPSPFMPHTPMFQLLSPGQQIEAEVSLKLPLREWDAYQPRRRSDTWPVEVRTVEMRVGYRVGPFDSIVELEDHPDYCRTSGGTGVGTASSTAVLPEPVRLLRRLGGFKRFV